MQILETFLCGKENNPATCEDGIFLSPYLVVVIDGVTAKGKRLWNGMKSGNCAKELLQAYFHKQVRTGMEQLTAEELFGKLDHILAEKIEQADGELQPEEYPRASIIVYNDFYKEIWSYGDCQCSINGIVYGHEKKIDVLNAEQRAYVLEYYLLQGMSLDELRENDLGRTAIEENLMRQYQFENRVGEFGYPVLNGRGIEPRLISRYSVHEGDEVILASDGYPYVKSTLAESEAYLQKLIQEDDMCFRSYHCTKGVKPGNVSFDDRAFCRLRV